ncbi:conserved hypothetical protein [Histoplasma capsulatum var. duboisii H88]|uniref:Major facilitator superfamily (MFS) profile domain-containing protein n=1 Tax=Ajellomyces capsulatus (strain H88) TaxID=544711 RepID=F0UKG0_AJEC8|nr:conserved hypothetical protein [Histoplasma capsulatum var. duboisii H88]
MPNIFQQQLIDTPREVLNWKLGLGVLCFGIMGASRGIDEGLISGTVNQKSFIAEYHLDDPDMSTEDRASRLGNITGMVQIGSILGALLAFIVTDRIGRIWATRELCAIWMVGIAIFMTADGRIGQVYAGRFIAGIGIGQTTVVAPTYLAEISPRAIRGLCTCAFSGSVYLGIMLSYFASWGSSIHLSNTSAKQWLFILPSNRYRVMIGLMSQLLSQWSGANSITIYAPGFFALLGTTGQSEKLFATAIFGVVKFVSSLVCALFLVDFLGRKRALGYGITLQFVSMLYVAIYLAVVPSIQSGFIPDGHSKRAGTVAIVSIYVSGVGWALGWNNIQIANDNNSAVPHQRRNFPTSSPVVGYINGDVLPLRQSIPCFAVKAREAYGNSKAVPTMLLDTAMRPYGTFFFFAMVTLIGLVWMWFFLPETAGKSLEAMDEMFSLPWYIIGRKGAAITAGSGHAEAYRSGDVEKNPISSECREFVPRVKKEEENQ